MLIIAGKQSQQMLYGKVSQKFRQFFRTVFCSLPGRQLFQTGQGFFISLRILLM